MALGHVVIVDSAVRDEGTSYHYLPPACEVQADTDVVAVLTEMAERAEVPFVVGKCWTTDGFFRETRGKVARRRDEGCIVVDAEAAALLAVASFRGVSIGQLLYAGDDLSGMTWDDRRWKSADAARRSLFDLAATSALQLAEARHT
jgi:uridine phosphorylase